MTAGTRSGLLAAAPYSPGLEGVIAGETAVCQVDASGMLLYRGYDIHDLATRATFEDVAWLLLRGQYPTSRELEYMRRELAEQAALPDPVMAAMRLFPADAHPIDMLRTGVSMLGSFDAELKDSSREANVRKAVRLTARIGAMVPAAWRVVRGGETPRCFEEEPSFARRFLTQLNGAQPPDWQVAVLDTVLVLYAEHEFNASTFAARVTASTLSDIYAAVTSAIAALKGPLHGGANEEVMNLLRDIGDAENAAAWARDKLRRKEKVMGFGHRIYRSGDSRVPAMRDLVSRVGRMVNQPHWAAICEALEAVMSAEKGLCANVDLYAAPVLHMMGIPTALNTPIFACARTTGWCAHVIEQLDQNRLIRPSSRYTGPIRRTIPTAARTEFSCANPDSV